MYICIFMYISVINMHTYKYVRKLPYVYTYIYIVPVPSQNNHWIILIYLFSFCYKKLVSINYNIVISSSEQNKNEWEVWTLYWKGFCHRNLWQGPKKRNERCTCLIAFFKFYLRIMMMTIGIIFCISIKI